MPDSDLYLNTLDTGSSPQRFTSEGTTNYRPNWYLDGQALTYMSNREGRFGIWTRPADFSGAATPVPVPGLEGGAIYEGFFAPGDTPLLAFQTGSGINGNIYVVRYVVRPGVDDLPVDLVGNDFVEHSVAISPGRRGDRRQSGELAASQQS